MKNIFYAKNMLHLCKEYAAPIVDVIEDFLDARGVILPGSQKEKSLAGDPDNEAVIYGEDYDELLNEISDALANLMKEVRPDVEVNNYSFGNSEISSLLKSDDELEL